MRSGSKRGKISSSPNRANGRGASSPLALPRSGAQAAATLAPRPLPPNSVPLHFRLLPTLNHGHASSSPVACLTASLPFRRHRPRGVKGAEGQHAVEVQDLRLGSEEAAVEVVRILDPEHREPFVSLGRIFLAVGISPLEGLLLNPELRRPAFDSTLAGIAPFIDIWVPLKTARAIAEDLEVLGELAGLLEWESRKAFSVEDREEGGMVHNWKIGSDRIDPSRYSTSAMLSTPFPRVHLLPPATQVRTLLPTSPFPSSPSTLIPSTYPALYSHLIDWTITELESHLSPSPPPSPSLSSNHADLAPTLLFTTLLSLLTLTDLLPPSSDESTYQLPGLPIERADLATTGRLGLVDAVARLVGREWRLQEEREVLHRRGKTSEKPQDAKESSDEQQGELERRVQKLEEALVSPPDEPRKLGTMMVVEEPKEETSTQDLSEEVHTLSARVAQLERALASPVTSPKLDAGQGGQHQLNLMVVLLAALLMVVTWPALSGVAGLGIHN